MKKYIYLLLLFSVSFIACTAKPPDNSSKESELEEGAIRCNSFAKKVITNFMREEFSNIRSKISATNKVGYVYKFCPDCKTAQYYDGKFDDQQDITTFLGNSLLLKGTTGEGSFDFVTSLDSARLEALNFTDESGLDIAISDDCQSVTLEFDVSGSLLFKNLKRDKLNLDNEVKITLGSTGIWGTFDAETTWDFGIHYKIESESFLSVDSEGNPGIGYFFKKPIVSFPAFSLKAGPDCNNAQAFGLPDIFKQICPRALAQIGEHGAEKVRPLFESLYTTAIQLHKTQRSCFFRGDDLNCGGREVAARPYFAMQLVANRRICLTLSDDHRLIKTVACQSPQSPVNYLLFDQLDNGKLLNAVLPTYCLASPQNATKADGDPDQEFIRISGCVDQGISMIENARHKWVSQASKTNKFSKHSSGLCLDVKDWDIGDSNVVGRRLSWWHCKTQSTQNVTNQTFERKEVFIIRSSSDQGLCFQAQENEQLTLQRCNGNISAQLFKVYSDETIRLAHHRNLCLAYQKDGDNFPRVTLESCSKAGARAKGFVHERSYNIVKEVDGQKRCIDSEGAHEGSRLRLHTDCSSKHNDQLYWFHVE